MDMLRLQSSSGAEYFHQKLTHEVGPRALQRLLASEQEVQLVDVRQPAEFDAEHIPQAVNLPFEGGQQSQYIYHLSKHIPVVVYSHDEDCTVALESAYLLARNGYAVRTLIGGFAGWKHYHLPVVANQEGSALRPYQAVDDFLPPYQP